MNMQADIITNLENKGYDDLTKIRWLYLYVCEMFSYDTRFSYANDDLKKEIYNKNINIENVEDFEIVCYTISKLLVEALNLCGFHAEIIKEHDGTFSHVYVVVKHKNYNLKLDPTKRRDITRVKMHSATQDFISLDNNPTFKNQLEEADNIIKKNSKKINFEEFYNSDSIEKIVKIIEENAKIRNLSEEELFYEKLEYICSLVNSRTDFKRYDDIDYYYAYLLKKFHINKSIPIDNQDKTEAKYPVRPTLFFKIGDKTMKDIINISYVQYSKKSPVYFFLMEKEDENYKMREIYKDEAIELLKNYHSSFYQFTFEKAALQLPKKRKNNIIL